MVESSVADGDRGLVGEEAREPAASDRLRDPAEVVAWLERLLCSRPAKADLENHS